MRRNKWNKVIAGLTFLAPVPYVIAYADVYMTEDQAASSLFPSVQMEPRTINLTHDDMKAIQSASGERTSSPEVKVWVGQGGEMVFIDRVLGKHEFITYAVGITPDGKVKGIEILQYNETYGYQIRNDNWRWQFTGKTSEDTLKVSHDIVNISGATLSCTHVTNGVRRILHTLDIIRTRIQS